MRNSLLFRHLSRVARIKNNTRGLSDFKIGDKKSLTGIFPPLATPFEKNETISWKNLEYNLSRYENIPFRGYVVQGSNGEFTYLSSEERVEMVRRVKEMVAANKLILAGSGCESTKQTIVMGNKMAEAGADVLLVATPCFYKARMNNDAMFQHYTEVANNSVAPILMYNVPSNTGIDIAPEVVLKLSCHPNIIGLKDSGGNISRIGNLCYQTKNEDFQILAGSADFLLSALMLGSVGAVCALADVLGQEVCDLHTLFQNGDMKAAVDLQHRLISPNAAVTREFGVPGLKTAMEWFGYYGGPTRLPLTPLHDTEKEKLREIFVKNNFL